MIITYQLSALYSEKILLILFLGLTRSSIDYLTDSELLLSESLPSFYRVTKEAITHTTYRFEHLRRNCR